MGQSSLQEGLGSAAISFPQHPCLGFPQAFALSGRSGKTPTWPFLLGLVWQSKGSQGWRKGFRASCFLPITTGCLSVPTTAGLFFCREVRGRASGGAACRKACESGPCFLIPVLSAGSEFPSLNVCMPREWQCSESTLLLSFLCGFF